MACNHVDDGWDTVCLLCGFDPFDWDVYNKYIDCTYRINSSGTGIERIEKRDIRWNLKK